MGLLFYLGLRSYKLASVKKALSSIALVVFSLCGFAQSAYKPYDADYYHLIERYEIKQKTFSGSFHSTVHPFSRKSIADFVDSTSRTDIKLSNVDKFNLEYLAVDNWEWMPDADSLPSKYLSNGPVLRHLYTTKADLWFKRPKGLDIHVSPVVHGMAGYDPDAGNSPLISHRGMMVRGSVGNSVGFYMEAADVEFQPMGYVSSVIEEQRFEFRRQLPGEGFFKNLEGGGYEFFNARGHISFALSPYIEAQFGHGKQFIGNGYRSIVLSNFSDDFTFLKLNTKVWRFNYTNIFGKLTANNTKFNGTYPVKYMAFHRLGINITDNFNIGVYESIITSRHDTTGGNSLDVSYLNPVMFYRSLEHDLGDGDNASLGIDFKWNIWKGVQLYGQLYMDELIFKEFVSGDGWWGNKQAFQIGAKYIDAFGVSNLDLQGEWNYVRPFTYTHYSLPGTLSHQGYSNHQHYNQPLAHPLGANFSEWVGIARWQPLKKLTLTGKLFYAIRGTDKLNENGKLITNHGSNILLDYGTRESLELYGVRIGYGVKATWLMADLTATYMLKHNLFFDLKFTHRDYNSEDDFRDLRSTMAMFSVRLNLGQRLFEF